jgi:hypothetical protein
MTVNYHKRPTRQEEEMKYLALATVALDFALTEPGAAGVGEWQAARKYIIRLKEEKRRSMENGTQTS